MSTKYFPWEYTEVTFDKASALRTTTVVVNDPDNGYMIAEEIKVKAWTQVRRCYLTPAAKAILDNLIYSDGYPTPMLPFGFTVWVKTAQGLKKAIDWNSTEAETFNCLRVGNHVCGGGDYPWVLTSAYDPDFIADYYACSEAIEEAERQQWRIENPDFFASCEKLPPYNPGNPFE